MFYIDIEHKGLGKFRRVSGADMYVVEQKAAAQRQVWDEQWRKKCAVESVRKIREASAVEKEAKKSEAIRQTEEAEAEIAEIRSILVRGCKLGIAFDWSNLYDHRPFQADLPSVPPRPAPTAPPPPPLERAQKYVPRSSILSIVFPSVKRRYEEAARTLFQSDHEDWTKKSALIKEHYQEALRLWEAYKTSYERKLVEIDQQKIEYEQKQAASNAKVDDFHRRYLAKDSGAICEYIDWVLSLSKYPECFPKRWQMDYISESGVLVIDYDLPPLEALPNLKAVKYVQSRDSFEQSYLRENELAQLYESALYQACLRTIREIFTSDEANAVSSVTFNGLVDFLDKSTGKPARACIMSLQASKEIYAEIKLDSVDPKACFRSLKGVGSAKLAGMSAVVPILRLNKNDERFVPAHDVIDSVAEATNVAAISWEEFEYLVRDIFEKEFSTNGGEVKITRASRDHGVDAIAFDPDPIRGGKIVIQAKRYTNLVGVSAVRDLYGTLINEGANRGILVTTSQYGPDSYEFAKDKPITLLDGGNLLSLLERHGHKARIDLAEAKKLGAARDER